jgi:hypothetical protein
MQVKRQPPISSIGGPVLNKESFKRAVAALAKHIRSNAPQYVAMIGAATQEDYSTVFTHLKVLVLRSVIGAIQRRVSNRKKDDDDTKN